MKELHEEYPASPMWHSSKCKVYVCPNDLESYRFLRMIGNQSNTANLVSLAQDFPDFVKGMRQQMRDLSDQCTKK